MINPAMGTIGRASLAAKASANNLFGSRPYVIGVEKKTPTWFWIVAVGVMAYLVWA